MIENRQFGHLYQILKQVRQKLNFEILIHKTGFRRAGHILQYALYPDSIEIFISLRDLSVLH